MTKITQSFIFAAGRGQRMRPLTDNIPKPLVSIRSKAILDYIVEKIDKIDFIEKIVINGHYLSEQIESHISKLNNPKIEFSKEVEKLETGGGLVFAAKNAKIDINQPILLINGDILWQEQGDASEIENLSKFYEENDCDILLGLKKTAEVFGYEGNGDFDLSEDGNLIRSPAEKHLHSHVFVGLQIINPRILEFAPEKFFSMSYFYKNHEKLGIKMKGLELQSKFFHIGDVKTYDLMQDIDLI